MSSKKEYIFKKKDLIWKQHQRIRFNIICSASYLAIAAARLMTYAGITSGNISGHLPIRTI